MKRIAIAVAALLFTLAVAPPAQAERVKDLAQVAGVRGNPLIGYGLVVGLDAAATAPARRPSPCRACAPCWTSWACRSRPT